MADYILSCCSTADLSAAHFKQRDIRCAYFHYTLDGKQYDDDLGVTMPLEKFYAAMAAGAETSTSMLNVDEYVDYFTPFLEQGKDILHLCLSSGISGSFTAARAACDELRARYPERRLFVVDSLAASSGCGLLMDKLADLRDEGYDLESLYHWAEAHKLEMHHWFFSTDLTYYIRGGRITKAAGWFGTVLNICPLMNVDVHGRLIPRQKLRGKKRAIAEIVEKMVQYAQDGTDYSEKCYVAHSASEEDARAVAALVEARFPKLRGRVEIQNIGTTIGSHSGPGTVALFFWGARRVN